MLLCVGEIGLYLTVRNIFAGFLQGFCLFYYQILCPVIHGAIIIVVLDLSNTIENNHSKDERLFYRSVLDEKHHSLLRRAEINLT